MLAFLPYIFKKLKFYVLALRFLLYLKKKISKDFLSTYLQIFLIHSKNEKNLITLNN